VHLILDGVVLMVSGLLVSIKNGCNLKLENVNPIEEFEGLKLRNKYGFDLGWYTLGEKIHVILKYVNEGETQIYLADNKIEVESIMNKVINKVVEDFSVDEKDQKEIYIMLKKHGCCYF
jgi:ribosomal protein S1